MKTSILIHSPSIRIDSLARMATLTNQSVIRHRFAGVLAGGKYVQKLLLVLWFWTFLSICPARYMAFSAIWIAVASLISAFDIKKATDENGNINEPTHEYLSAFLRCVSPFPACLFYLLNFFSSTRFPKPYKCSIKPRSKEAEALIRSVANQEVV